MFMKKSNDNAGTKAAEGADDTVFDVGIEDFEMKVMGGSMETLVLVDFWAPWCGPCKQLMPVLEQEVRAAGGKVRLAKVNIDDNPELAQALRVQSVPTVYAFFQGQPVNAFTGMRPQSEIKTFIDQLVRAVAQAQPDAINVPEALQQAGQALAGGDLAQAQGLYMRVLAQEETNVQAYAGLVRVLIAAGQLEQARGMVEHAPDAIAADPGMAAARTAVALAEAAPKGDQAELQARIELNGDDHAARFDLAMMLFASGKKDLAIDELVEIIRRDRAWEDEKARKQLLQFFEALGPSAPETMTGRRKLSAVLFS